MGSSPSRHRQLLMLLAMGACVCAVVLAAPAAGAVTTAPRCSSSQLRLRFVGFQGATSHRYWQLAWRNVGRTCSLRGFSRVQLLAQDGHVITPAFRHETGFPIRTVVVGHDKRAFVAYTYVDGGFCDSGQFHAPKARLIPPGDRGGFVFNMAPRNMGPPYLCPGTEGVFPVTSKPGP